MRLLSGIGLVAAFGLFLGLSDARAEEKEEKVPLDRVPKAVMKAVKAKFAGAKVRGAAKEEEDGKTFYEVSLTDDDEKIDVLARPNGTIVEIERQIDVDDLPDRVADAVQAKYPRAKIKKAEKLTKGDEVSYEVIIETSSRKQREIALNRKGKVLDDEEAEDDKGDKADKDGKKAKKGKNDKDDKDADDKDNKGDKRAKKGKDGKNDKDDKDDKDDK